MCDVLIVVDDGIQCEAIAECLGRAGLAVQMVHYGASALRQAGAFSSVPRCSSVTSRTRLASKLAGHLRAFPPETTIIMMSGHIDGLSEKILAMIGITVFVNKPLPLCALREAALKLVRSAPIDQMAWCQQKGRLSAGFGGTRH
jgi:DNA-binding NtrC family response regulator